MIISNMSLVYSMLCLFCDHFKARRVCRAVSDSDILYVSLSMNLSFGTGVAHVLFCCNVLPTDIICQQQKTDCDELEMPQSVYVGCCRLFISFFLVFPFLCCRIGRGKNRTSECYAKVKTYVIVAIYIVGQCLVLVA